MVKFHHAFEGPRNPSALLERIGALKTQLSLMAFAVYLGSDSTILDGERVTSENLIKAIDGEINDFIAGMALEEAQPVSLSEIAREFVQKHQQGTP